jgi:hypothetical protein
VSTYAWHVDPLKRIQYDMYVANWTYGTCMLVLDVQTLLRGDAHGLGLTDGDISLLRG